MNQVQLHRNILIAQPLQKPRVASWFLSGEIWNIGRRCRLEKAVSMLSWTRNVHDLISYGLALILMSAYTYQRRIILRCVGIRWSVLRSCTSSLNGTASALASRVVGVGRWLLFFGRHF